MEIQKEQGPPPSVNLGPKVLPYSLDVISDFLANFVPPEGPFDPDGSWDHRYYSVVALRGRVGSSNKTGHLRIQRNVGLSRVDFTISQSIGIGGSRRELLEAQVECAGGPLSTPVRWEIHSVVAGTGDNKAVEYTELRQRGEAAGRTVTFSGSTNRKVRVPEDFTGSWLLFDVVQRLPFDTKPIRFEMFDDLERLKSRQQLAPGPAVEITVSGQNLRLHSFEQVGEGILPYCYWLDDQHRLLMAVGGLRAFVWDPAVSIPEFPR